LRGARFAKTLVFTGENHAAWVKQFNKVAALALKTKPALARKPGV